MAGLATVADCAGTWRRYASSVAAKSEEVDNSMVAAWPTQS